MSLGLRLGNGAPFLAPVSYYPGVLWGSRLSLGFTVDQGIDCLWGYEFPWDIYRRLSFGAVDVPGIYPLPGYRLGMWMSLGFAVYYTLYLEL